MSAVSQANAKAIVRNAAKRTSRLRGSASVDALCLIILELHPVEPLIEIDNNWRYIVGPAGLQGGLTERSATAEGSSALLTPISVDH
jgi:hypothetical protein